MIRLDAVERLLTRHGGRLCVATVFCLFLISVIGRGYRERPVRVAGGLDFSEYSVYGGGDQVQGPVQDTRVSGAQRHRGQTVQVRHTGQQLSGN